MRQRLARWWRHWGVDEADVRRALGPGALERIEQRIAASERRHHGEIRVCIEAGLSLADLWRDVSARERAVTMFSALRVWDTEANNGVLIHLLLAERHVEIVADRGIDHHVPPGHWVSIVDAMRADFRGGRFEAGLLRAIDAVEALQLKHFPLVEGRVNPNELPDRPHVGS